MIQIKPRIDHHSTCPTCGAHLAPQGVRWQGMHVGVQTACSACGSHFVEDLPVAHAVNYPYMADLTHRQLFRVRHDWAAEWFGEPFLQSLLQPDEADLPITKEVFARRDRVILLNCLDNFYGHCLLRLLNAERHLREDADLGLIVIVPRLLRWLVPDGVAEVWTVDLPLKHGTRYYRAFDAFVAEQCERFHEIYVSRAHSHPGRFDVSTFTRVPKYEAQGGERRVTFIWREDRLWMPPSLQGALNRLGLKALTCWIQNRKVQRLFDTMRSQLPEVRFAVGGLGTSTRFPAWIEDRRVERYDDEREQDACRLYASSSLVVGIHGSNMLLPSGHAGMTLDLMPDNRWGNIGQDILYQEPDPRLASYRYRFVPQDGRLETLATIAVSMLRHWAWFEHTMTADAAAGRQPQPDCPRGERR